MERLLGGACRGKLAQPVFLKIKENIKLEESSLSIK